jgi:acyl-CoA thioester hydrolase
VNDTGVRVEIPVRWGDMDALGHVNNAIYFQYCEVARFAVFEALRIRECQAKPSDGPGLVRAELNFRRQVKYPATLEVEAHVTASSEKSFTIGYTLRDRSDGELVADGSSICVWVDYDGPRALPLPTALRAAIARLEQARR